MRYQAFKSWAYQKGVFVAKEVTEAGLYPQWAYRGVKEGFLQKQGRCFVAQTQPITENFDLILVTKQIPRAVFCLETALVLHQISPAHPHEIYVALGLKEKSPQFSWPPISVIRMKDPQIDVTTMQVDGVQIQVTDLEKTLVDCFKFQHVMPDLARQALKEAWLKDRINIHRLQDLAQKHRVMSRMGPLLEFMRA